MKKKYVIAIAVIFLLTGCTKYKKLECKHQDENSNMKTIMNQAFYFDEDGKNIKKMTIKTEYLLKEQYIDYLNKNGLSMDSTINTDSMCNSYKSFDNVSCNKKIKDNSIVVEVKIDISKKNKDEISGDYKFYKDYFEGMKYECK